MIKIIKVGTRKITTCENCGCKFSYEEEDVTSEGVALGNFKDIVICPQCEGKVTIMQTR